MNFTPTLPVLRKAILPFVALVSSLAFQCAHAQTNDDFRVSVFTVDQVSEPQPWPTAVIQFLDSPEGRTAASAVAAYFGVDPIRVNAYISAAREFHKQVNHPSGEETQGHISFDEGYSICKVVAAGIVSQTCDSHISTDIGGPDGHQVGFYTAVPKKRPTEGRCWVEAKFVALLIRRDLKATSHCAANNDRVMDCAGDSCRFGPGVKRLDGQPIPFANVFERPWAPRYEFGPAFLLR